MAQWCHRSSPSNVARVQNPGVGAICGLSLLLVLSFAPRGFSPGTPVFPSTLKPTFLSSNSTRNQEDEEPLCGGATSKSLLLLFYYCILKKRTTNSTGIRENWIKCLLYKVLLYLHIFLVLNKNCTEPYLVRYVEALYIYTQIKIILQFLSVNPSKSSPHWSNINMQKVFKRRYTVFIFNL